VQITPSNSVLTLTRKFGISFVAGAISPSICVVGLKKGVDQTTGTGSTETLGRFNFAAV
jgi:hypothetical protein